MMQLTNDTYRILRLIYDEYQNRRKIGMSKTEAILFSYPSALQTELSTVSGIFSPPTLNCYLLEQFFSLFLR